jgi:hypothetical protein
MKEKRRLTNTLLVGFLAHKKFKVTPYKEGKTVSFDVEGERLSEAIQEFYNNPLIPIQDFCQCYKTIRNMMFDLRGD